VLLLAFCTPQIACPWQVLVELGLVTQEELRQSIATEFNPVHIGFYSEKQRPDLVVHDTLNLGVNPR